MIVSSSSLSSNPLDDAAVDLPVLNMPDNDGDDRDEGSAAVDRFFSEIEDGLTTKPIL